MSYDSSLASIARKHSADMARTNYFAHVNLQGLDPSGGRIKPDIPVTKIMDHITQPGLQKISCRIISMIPLRLAMEFPGMTGAHKRRLPNRPLKGG